MYACELFQLNPSWWFGLRYPREHVTNVCPSSTSNPHMYGTGIGIVSCCICGTGTVICAGGLWVLFNNMAAICCSNAFWFALSWLIALITNSWMEFDAGIAFSVDSVAAFIVATCVSVVSVAVVSSSLLSPKMVYILLFWGVYLIWPAVLRSCCAKMRCVNVPPMKVLSAVYVFGVIAS